MTIRIVLVLTALVLLPIFASAQVPSYWLLEDPGNSEIERRLERQIDFEFVKTPLSEAVEHIRKAGGVPCVIKSSALDAVGLGLDVPVTYRGRAVRIRDGLRMILSEVALSWTIENRHLVVTTPEDAEENLITKAYDVRHFIEAEWQPVVRQSESGATETTYEYSCDFRWLIDLITSTIHPVTWGDVGGPGAINGIANRRMRALIVSQTFEVHREIEMLFRNLAKLRSTDPLPIAPPVDIQSGQITSRSANPRLHRTSSIRSSYLRTTGQ